MKKYSFLFIILLLSIASFGQTYFAEVINDTVRRVIVADQSFVNSGALGNPSNWIETDYYAHGGVGLRKNYAGIGYMYDPVRDGFIPPQPHQSAFIVDNTCLWDFYELPAQGTWLDAGTAWKYTSDGDTIIVQVVQSHNRTSHDPRAVPALFSVLQFGIELMWIAGEAVMIGDERLYATNDTWYRCIQSHQTQAGWEPPNVPALWQNMTVSPFWTVGVAYSVNQQIIYQPNGFTYKCLQAHTSQAGWTPPAVPALWQQL